MRYCLIFQGTLSFRITAYDRNSYGPVFVSQMAQNITLNATQFGHTEKTRVAFEGKKRQNPRIGVATPKLTAEFRYVEIATHHLSTVSYKYVK